jgi:hypothetical protein
LQEDVTAAGRKEATTGAGGGGAPKKNPQSKNRKKLGITRPSQRFPAG